MCLVNYVWLIPVFREFSPIDIGEDELEVQMDKLFCRLAASLACQCAESAIAIHTPGA